MSNHLLWKQLSAILVIFMTIPGLAMFYGGLVSKKNVLSVFGQCFVIASMATIMWVLVGYSLCFSSGGSWQPFIGGGRYFFLNHIVNVSHTPLNIHRIFNVVFQLGFAILTPTIIVGSGAERIRFSALLIFIFFWELLVYYPICHWVWGGGWLMKLGVLDFAGGAVVHLNAGIAGLVMASLLGHRQCFSRKPLPAHNLTLVVVGTGILWVGWFGFNSGNALHLYYASRAIIMTQLAASMSLVTYVVFDQCRSKKTPVTGILIAAVSGLVAITPAAGYVGIVGALCIGFVAGMVCQACISLKYRLNYDDSLDAFGIHGICGFLGAILTGIFFSPILGGLGASSPTTIWHQLSLQVIGVVAVIVWSAFLTYVLLRLLALVLPLRVSSEDESQGLDQAAHGESGYNL